MSSSDASVIAAVAEEASSRPTSASINAAAPISPEQVAVQMPAAAATVAQVEEQGKEVAAAPVATPSPTPSPPTPSHSFSSSSSSSGNKHAPSNLLSTLQSQITPACHVTQADAANGTEGNVYVHVIDGTGQFSCTPADLTYLVLHCQKARESSYSVVGIMGCQSTGKSTLLNLLFGTKFQEMDSSQGRSQTTKGVWMDSGSNKRDLVVMDLEGTDSGERGEDRTTFERQTSLYALAVAEVLLINMWEHDIGRYTASNYGILKTVFEVNLQLFDAQNKTVLMFVIRDHIEEDTPMVQLQQKLHKEVDKIWGEIRKPDKFRDTPVSELFELRYFCLPHMKLQKALFVERVGLLRQQFIAPGSADYLFASDFHGRKSVPADGFGVYMEQCWTTIRDNKELNLPTQKEMLATFRCDEIIHSVYTNTFTPQLAELKEAASKQLVADQFAQTCEPLIRSILAAYTDETKHYHTGIVAAKRRELLRKMSRELEEIFATQARKFVAKQTLDVFRAELKLQLAKGVLAASSSSAPAATPSSNKKFAALVMTLMDLSSSHDAPHPNFAAATAHATKLAMDYARVELAKFSLPILSAVQEASPDGAEEEAIIDPTLLAASSAQDPLLSWTTLARKVEEELQAAVEGCIGVERALQLKKLSFHLDKVFKSQLSAPLTAILKKATPRTMWADVGKLYRKVRTAVIQQYVLDTLAVSYACAPEEAAALAEQSETQLSQLCRLIVDQHTGMISLHLRSKFDALFRYDAEGRIRKWGASDNIRKVFKHARDETLQLLDLFAIFRLDEFKEADSEANKQLAREDEEAKVRATASSSKSRSVSRRNLLDESKDVASPSSATSSSAAAGESADSDDEEASVDDEKIGQSGIDYSKVDAANIILDATARLEKESTFRFDIEGALREAELQQQQNEEKTKVPMWMIGLVLFLGMDEVLAVLRNPFLLVLIVVVGGGAFMAHQVGALWPMISVAKATAKQFIIQAQASFNAPPVLVKSSSSRRPSIGSRLSNPRNLSLSKSFTPLSPQAAAAGQRSDSSAAPSVEMADLHVGSPVAAEEESSVEVAAVAVKRGSINNGATLKKRVSVQQADE